MRLILIATLLLLMVSFVQAEQTTGKGASEFDACMNANPFFDIVEMPPAVENAVVNLLEYYTVEECVCTDRSSELRDDIPRAKPDAERWVCTVNYYKTPGKW